MPYKKVVLCLFFLFSLLTGITFYSYFQQQFNDPRLVQNSDFNNYLTGAILLRNNQGHHLYNLSISRPIQKSLAYPFKTPSGPFRGLPITALFYVPLTFFPILIAQKIYLLISFLIYLTTLIILRLYFFKSLNIYLYFISALLFTPFLIGVLQYQPTIFEFSTYTLSLIFFSRRQYFISGLFLSLLIIKPQVLLPLVIIFLATRNTKFIFGLFLSLLAHLLFSLITLGFNGLLNYPHYLSLTENPQFGSFLDGYTGIPSFIISNHLPKLFIFTTIVVFLCLAIFLFFTRSFSKISATQLYAIAPLLSFCFSLHIAHHNLSLLLISLFYFLSKKEFILALLLFFLTYPYGVNPIIPLRSFLYLFIALTQIPTLFSRPLFSRL